MIYDWMYSDMHEPNQHRHGKVTSDTKKTKSGDGGDGGRHTSYDDDAANNWRMRVSMTLMIIHVLGTTYLVGIITYVSYYHVSSLLLVQSYRTTTG
jgi:hypothetical protein